MQIFNNNCYTASWVFTLNPTEDEPGQGTSKEAANFNVCINTSD